MGLLVTIIFKGETKMKSCETCRNYEEKTINDLLDIPERLQNMTLAEIVFNYSSIAGLKTYAETLDKIMSAKRKAVEIKQMERDLTK